MAAIRYRPEIDGLRAVAVIPVVLFHLGLEWVSGGYMGVDVFFVISGYLITAILLKENDNEAFSFKNFWLRRIRRILPALLVMVMGTLIISYFIVFRPILPSYAGDALAAVFSYANFAMLFKFGDYWGAGAETSPFLHAWSLSVEEQFYVFYPVLVYLLYRKKVRQKLNPLYVLIGLSALSLVLFLYASVRYPHFSFYLLPTRTWELACGGILAMLAPKLQSMASTKLSKAIPSVGLVLVLVSYLSAINTEGIGPVVLLAVIGAMMIIGYASPYEPVGRVLGHPFPVFIGKISYSLYLWHWPFIVLAKQVSYKQGANQMSVLAIATILMIVISILSYYFVETPTRRTKGILRPVAILFIICISIIWIYKTPLVDKHYQSAFDKIQFYGLYYDISPTIPQASKERGKAKRAGIIAPERDSTFQYAYKSEGIITSDLDTSPAIVVLGDSHGAMWAKLIDEIGDEMGVKASFFTSVGNNVLFPISANRGQIVKRQGFSKEEWIDYVENIKHNLNLWKPRLLIVTNKWSIRKEEDFLNLEEIIQFVSKNGTRVLILNQPPIIDALGDNNAAQFLEYLGYEPTSGYQYIDLLNNELVHQNNRILSAISDKSPGNVEVFDVNSLYTKSNSALIINGKNILYYDDDHLSYQGTLLLKDHIKTTIVKYID